MPLMNEIKSKSEQLCEEISSISDSTCFLGFSRGKDSIAAWITLKRFFKKIIPFHCASLPNLSFVNKSLNYFEKYFQTKIHRFIDGEVLKGISNLWFQAIENEDMIDELDFPKVDKHLLVNYLRERYKLPNAWCAYGINMSDSIDRRIYVNKYQGRIENHKSFYPCFEFKKNDIMKIIIDSKIILPDDYKYANRTIAGMFSFRGLENIMNKNPEDFDRIETAFPFIKVIIARNKFREMSLCPIP